MFVLNIKIRNKPFSVVVPLEDALQEYLSENNPRMVFECNWTTHWRTSWMWNRMMPLRSSPTTLFFRGNLEIWVIFNPWIMSVNTYFEFFILHSMHYICGGFNPWIYIEFKKSIFECKEKCAFFILLEAQRKSTPRGCLRIRVRLIFGELSVLQ